MTEGWRLSSESAVQFLSMLRLQKTPAEGPLIYGADSIKLYLVICDLFRQFWTVWRSECVAALTVSWWRTPQMPGLCAAGCGACVVPGLLWVCDLPPCKRRCVRRRIACLHLYILILHLFLAVVPGLNGSSSDLFPFLLDHSASGRERLSEEVNPRSSAIPCILQRFIQPPSWGKDR